MTVTLHLHMTGARPQVTEAEALLASAPAAALAQWAASRWDAVVQPDSPLAKAAAQHDALASIFEPDDSAQDAPVVRLKANARAAVEWLIQHRMSAVLDMVLPVAGIAWANTDPLVSVQRVSLTTFSTLLGGPRTVLRDRSNYRAVLTEGRLRAYDMIISTLECGVGVSGMVGLGAYVFGPLGAHRTLAVRRALASRAMGLGAVEALAIEDGPGAQVAITSELEAGHRYAQRAPRPEPEHADFVQSALF